MSLAEELLAHTDPHQLAAHLAWACAVPRNQPEIAAFAIQLGLDSACLKSVDSPEGRRQVTRYLESQPHPHYEPAADAPGLLVRTEADGTRTVGGFVNRRFKPVKPKAARR